MKIGLLSEVMKRWIDEIRSVVFWLRLGTVVITVGLLLL
jgi:hypothetical protein